MHCQLHRVPWTSRRSNQSILEEINPEYSLEGLMRRLKLQYFGHLTLKANSLEKTLMLGKTEGRRRGWQRTIWLDGITRLNGHEFEQAPRDGKGHEGLACCSPWVTKSQTWLSDWATTRQVDGEPGFLPMKSPFFGKLWWTHTPVWRTCLLSPSHALIRAFIF